MWSLCGICAMLATAASPDEGVSDVALARFKEHTYQVAEGNEPAAQVKYRLMQPAAVTAGKAAPGESYPLVLFLHGAGERGSDNARQLRYFPELMATDEYRERFPCFVLAPQCPKDHWWVSIRRVVSAGESSDDAPPAAIETVEAILQHVLDSYPIDTRRVYLTGLSMGGYGSWYLGGRHPDRFAALVPICGGGLVQDAPRLVHIPIWAFHGAADPVVPPSRSRDMIEAIRQAGGSPQYTELEGVGHNSWTPAYSDREGVIPWMFRQVAAGSSPGDES